MSINIRRDYKASEVLEMTIKGGEKMRPGTLALKQKNGFGGNRNHQKLYVVQHTSENVNQTRKSTTEDNYTMSDRIVQMLSKAYKKLNEYFGTEHPSDQLWFFGFVLSCLFLSALVFTVNLINY